MAKHIPTPRCFIKAYRLNTLSNGQGRPDLTICEDPLDKQWFVFGGNDVDLGLFAGFTKGSQVHQSWHYERFEFYADGQNLTFVMPTISSDVVGTDDQISTPGGIKSFLRVRCHMLLLNGEAQGAQRQTTIAIKLDFFRDENGKTKIWTAQLGDKPKWGSGLFSGTVELSDFGKQLVNGTFTEDLKGMPGPLLQVASVPGFGGKNDNLEIKLVDIAYNQQSPDKLIKTFVLTFTPDITRGPLDLTATVDSKLPIPLHATKGTYRIIQRATDHWLAGKTGEEWLVQIDSDGFESLWNGALTEYRDALKTVRPVNRISLIPSIAIKPTAHGWFNLRITLTISRVVNQAIPYTAAFKDLQVISLKVMPPQNLDAVLTLHLGGGQKRDYSADIYAVVTSQTEGSFAFSVTLKDDPSPQSKSQVRIGSLDLEFGGNADGLPQTLQLLSVSKDSLTVPRMTANMQLPVASIAPGGQDGLPSNEYVPEYYQEASSGDEECMDLRFTGSAPVVIPVGRDPDTGSYLLTIDESNPNLYSQTIFLKLDFVPPRKVTAGAVPAVVPPSSAPQLLRVIVVDSDPFLVAAVEYFKLQPSTVTA
jgi:hypothetical protein